MRRSLLEHHLRSPPPPLRVPRPAARRGTLVGLPHLPLPQSAPRVLWSLRGAARTGVEPSFRDARLPGPADRSRGTVGASGRSRPRARESCARVIWRWPPRRTACPRFPEIAGRDGFRAARVLHSVGVPQREALCRPLGAGGGKRKLGRRDRARPGRGQAPARSICGCARPATSSRSGGWPLLFRTVPVARLLQRSEVGRRAPDELGHAGIREDGRAARRKLASTLLGGSLALRNPQARRTARWPRLSARAASRPSIRARSGRSAAERSR